MQNKDNSLKISLYKQTENCQTASITIGNLSKQVLDTECLQNAQQ